MSPRPKISLKCPCCWSSNGIEATPPSSPCLSVSPTYAPYSQSTRRTIHHRIGLDKDIFLQLEIDIAFDIFSRQRWKGNKEMELKQQLSVFGLLDEGWGLMMLFNNFIRWKWKQWHDHNPKENRQKYLGFACNFLCDFLIGHKSVTFWLGIQV